MLSFHPLTTETLVSINGAITADLQWLTSVLISKIIFILSLKSVFILILFLQVVHLLSQVEAQKLEVVRKEEELTLGSQRSRRDHEALLEARAQQERLEAQMSELQEQLEREMERRKSLEEEKERLEERLKQFREQRGGRDESGPLQADGHAVSIIVLLF